MANVLPFRSFRFDMHRHSSHRLARLVSSPYVGIEKEALDMPGAHSQPAAPPTSPEPARVTLSSQHLYPDARVAAYNLYTPARQRILEWLDSGVLQIDEEPMLYVYHQTFFSPHGVKLTRKGLIARVELEDYDRRVILPHERTLSAPKVDRLDLMKATQANLSQVFMLYDDPERLIDARLDALLSQLGPLLEITTDDGILHQLWGIEDADFAASITDFFASHKLLIADGHHRYETALAYRDFRRDLEPPSEDTPPDAAPYDFIMTLLVNMHDPGLLVLPTHRVIHGVQDFEPRHFLSQLERSPFFKLTPLPFEPRQPLVNQGLSWLTACEQSGASCPSFVLCSRHFDSPLLAQFVGSSSSAIFSHDIPEPVRDLDVTILHEGILDDMLGIDREAQALKTNLRYKKHLEEALLEMELPDTQLVVLMNATPVHQIQRVCESGGKMPQKSTYFYPKIMSGLMISPL